MPPANPASSGVYTIVPSKALGHDDVVAGEQIRVWVVDDQASFRRATAATLAAMDDFVMAGECETGETAVEQMRSGDGDIVLMDIHMPGMGGIEAARQICSVRTDLIIVLMSTYDIEDLPAAAADCGAASYLHKERLSPDLLRRIWRAGG
ncbi:Response regulator receiver domain-containing protein [Mycolicibacterium fluoranthenivorans]|uniref:Response regulator receiver domain-containing protein n=1 Tax=Mycolicibacterium fluoranthenivorans TaxID=258505 RepID=A0A1G4X061_9MYCO|nr:Response regulator receiver domain-containing protein [Mycolicibacterium fluoranthenivorans]